MPQYSVSTLLTYLFARAALDAAAMRRVIRSAAHAIDCVHSAVIATEIALASIDRKNLKFEGFQVAEVLEQRRSNALCLAVHLIKSRQLVRLKSCYNCFSSRCRPYTGRRWQVELQVVKVNCEWLTSSQFQI